MANGLPEGIKLQVLLLEPGRYDANGNLFVDPKDLEWKDADENFVVSDSTQCSHYSTVCTDCVDSWRCDWDFRIADSQGSSAEWLNLV
jgi:hypothetical protein